MQKLVAHLNRGMAILHPMTRAVITVHSLSFGETDGRVFYNKGLAVYDELPLGYDGTLYFQDLEDDEVTIASNEDIAKMPKCEVLIEQQSSDGRYYTSCQSSGVQQILNVAGMCCGCGTDHRQRLIQIGNPDQIW